MKKIIMCLALLIVVNSIYSQQNNKTTTLTKGDYLKKSKNQKTAAWIFTAGGAGLFGLGVSDSENKGGNSDGDRKGVLIVTGLAAVCVGITFFISSSANKKRADALSFKMERSPVIQQGNFVYRSYPALSFRLNL